jgi:hypothetical protein
MLIQCVLDVKSSLSFDFFQKGTPQYKRRFLVIFHQKSAFILRGPEI